MHKMNYHMHHILMHLLRQQKIPVGMVGTLLRHCPQISLPNKVCNLFQYCLVRFVFLRDMLHSPFGLHNLEPGGTSRLNLHGTTNDEWDWFKNSCWLTYDEPVCIFTVQIHILSIQIVR